MQVVTAVKEYVFKFYLFFFFFFFAIYRKIEYVN